MTVPLPDISEAECTPLVRQLIDIIGHLQNRIQELEDEVLRLKGLKTRPIIAPSPLETPPRPPRDPGQKRPGSAKRLKTAQLTITDEVVVPLADPPPGSTFKGYEDFVVGYCQILWMTVFQAAGFSCFTPSIKTTPAVTSGRSFEPFKARHPFEADSINLYTIVRHADR